MGEWVRALFDGARWDTDAPMRPRTISSGQAQELLYVEHYGFNVSQCDDLKNTIKPQEQSLRFSLCKPCRAPVSR